MKIEIKAYGKAELASFYYPNIQAASARRNLTRWIQDMPELKKKLDEAGYRHKGILLSPAQVKIIVEFLGEPTTVEN